MCLLCLFENFYVRRIFTSLYSPLTWSIVRTNGELELSNVFRKVNLKEKKKKKKEENKNNHCIAVT